MMMIIVIRGSMIALLYFFDFVSFRFALPNNSVLELRLFVLLRNNVIIIGSSAVAEGGFQFHHNNESYNIKAIYLFYFSDCHFFIFTIL